MKERITHGSVYHALQSLRDSPSDSGVAVGFYSSIRGIKLCAKKATILAVGSILHCSN
jgi:hypothetical protein